MKIIINGGGIAGFALARFLVGRGIEAVVLERAPAFSALGHIIALKADGVDVLDRLGIRADCNARALPGITDLNFATAGGYPLRAQPLVGIDAALHGFLALRRADLHAALHARVKDDVDIRFGRQVDTFTEDPGGVAVTLSDGTTLRGDALIGADGVHSVIRRRLFGDAGERPSCSIARRGAPSTSCCPLCRRSAAAMSPSRSNYRRTSRRAACTASSGAAARWP